MAVKVGSALWNRVFGEKQEADVLEAVKSDERRAGAIELVSRPAFQREVIQWLEDSIKASRVIPGAHEDMLYRAGFRDGLETALDRMKSLQELAKEKYDEQ